MLPLALEGLPWSELRAGIRNQCIPFVPRRCGRVPHTAARADSDLRQRMATCVRLRVMLRLARWYPFGRVGLRLTSRGTGCVLLCPAGRRGRAAGCRSVDNHCSLLPLLHVTLAQMRKAACTPPPPGRLLAPQPHRRGTQSWPGGPSGRTVTCHQALQALQAKPFACHCMQATAGPGAVCVWVRGSQARLGRR